MTLLKNNAVRAHPAIRKWPENPGEWEDFLRALDEQELSAASLPPGGGSWTTTTAFSASDADTVAWGAGTLTTSAGGSYSIGAGNTGNMSARTYIYFDADTSTTAYQITTTAATAVGENKILVAVAENTSSEAFFQVFGGVGGTLITANEIAANTITANEIAATITWTKTLNVSTSGNISQGKSSASDTTQGFWLGYDGTSSYDFHIGDANGYLWWDGSGTSLTIKGSLLTANAVQTFTPTWIGFSSDPSEDISYINYGSEVAIIVPDAGGITGTSDATSFQIQSLPAAIQPSSVQTIYGGAFNNGVVVHTRFSITAGTIVCSISNVSGTQVQYDTAGWANTGSKGLVQGTYLRYKL